MKLYVGNFVYTTTEKELKEAAAKGVLYTIKENRLWFLCPRCNPAKIKVVPVVRKPLRRGKKNRPFD